MPHVTAKKMEKAKLTERILAKRLIPGVPSAMTELRQQVDSLTADIPFPALVCADGHAAGLTSAESLILAPSFACRSRLGSCLVQ